MNIILNHKHDTEISSQLDSANHLARTRTVDIHDVYYAVAVLNNKFTDCPKKSMEGLTVFSVDDGVKYCCGIDFRALNESFLYRF